MFARIEHGVQICNPKIHISLLKKVIGHENASISHIHIQNIPKFNPQIPLKCHRK